MGLIVYECQRADHGHEIRQFEKAAKSLHDYYEDRKEFAVFIGNINIGEANLDGLIVKNDAIIIVEFKDYQGNLIARQNGDWECDNKPIKGGNGGKSVYEQLKKNRRILRTVIAQSNYFNEAQRSDIKGLVVLSKLMSLEDDFDRDNKAWVFVSDIENIGKAMNGIMSRDFRDLRTNKIKNVYITNENIFNFLRKLKIDEKCLVTDFSDTSMLPNDLFHKESPHNGKFMSTSSQLEQKTLEVDDLKNKINELQKQLDSLKTEFQKEINSKDLLIVQQRTEIVQAMADKLEADKQAMNAQAEIERLSAQIVSAPLLIVDTNTEQAELLDEVNSISDDVETIKEKLQSKQTEVTHDYISIQPKKKRFGLKERVLKTFKIEKDSLDLEQLTLIGNELSNSMIVAGCAGSGKSVIAMYKAQQIIEEGGNVLLITYTKSLNKFTLQGQHFQDSKYFFYYQQWKESGMPSADYIIVDEVQDFTREEIEEFVHAARKCYFFFGDSAQSIYGKIKNTINIKELSDLTGIKISYLNSNYRLPKSIARVTQQYIAAEATPYDESVYQSKESSLPHFVRIAQVEEQIDSIIKIITKKCLKSVGILVKNNEQVMLLMKAFSKKRFLCEFKYNSKDNDKYNRITLNFDDDIPKLMTYHSAKGLQFDTVILPLLEDAHSTDERKALYVAMTRTYRDLYLMYQNTELPYPLNNVPKELYLDSL